MNYYTPPLSQDAFPFSPFFESLESLGIRPTLHDYRRISLVLSSKGKWDLAQLRSMLTALLVHGPEQEDAFVKRFNAFFQIEIDGDEAHIDIAPAITALREFTDNKPKKSRNKVPAKKIKKGRPSFPIILFLTRLAVLLSACLFVFYIISTFIPKQDLNVPDIVKPDEKPTTSISKLQRIYPDTPIIISNELVSKKNSVTKNYSKFLIGSGILATFLLCYLIWIRRISKPIIDSAPTCDDTRNRHFDPGLIGGEPSPQLDKESLDFTADLVSYFKSHIPSVQLDVQTSVKATTDRAGIPEVYFKKSKQVRTVIILEDSYAMAKNWNTVSKELARGLSIRAIPIIHGQFKGVPSRFMTNQSQVVSLEDLEDERANYLLFIFTDGKGIQHHRDRFALESIAQWPNVAWMELRETRSWDPSSAIPSSFGIPVLPATQSGILKAMFWFMTEHCDIKDNPDWIEWRGDFSTKHTSSLPVKIEVLLGDALPWAQVCSMMPPPFSLGLADLVRRQFFPEILPERIERLISLPNVTYDNAGVYFSQTVLAILRQEFFQRFSDEQQQTILNFLITQIRLAEPGDKKSPAHQAWEWRYQRLYMELDPDKALKRLSELANGRLGATIKRELSSVVSEEQSRTGETAQFPLRQPPKSRQGKIRLLALAKNYGIAHKELHPNLRKHYYGLTALTLTIIILVSPAIYQFIITQRDELNLKLEIPSTGVYRVLQFDTDIWNNIPATNDVVQADILAKGTESKNSRFLNFKVPQDQALQVTYLNEDEVGYFDLGKINNSRVIKFKTEQQQQPCVSEKTLIGVKVIRCPPSIKSSDQTIQLRSWREINNNNGRNNLDLSIGIDIRYVNVSNVNNSKKASEIVADEILSNIIADKLGDELLRLRQVDKIYQIKLSSDHASSFQKLMKQIKNDLGAWLGNTRLIWWEAKNQAKAEIKINNTNFGKVISFGRVAGDKWVESSLAQLKTSTDSKGNIAIPTIEIIDPSFVISGDTPTVNLRSIVKQREIIGRVIAPGELLVLTVNDQKVPVNKQGLFKVTVDIRSKTTLVSLVAIDKNGGKSNIEFILSLEYPIKRPPDGGAGRTWQLINFGKYHALIIGNNNYKNIPQLETPVNDATEIEKVLRSKYGFKTTLLLNGTRYDILSALNKLRAELTENDNLLIYYAGHGELDQVNQRGHWLPIDAEADNIANWISTVAITDILNSMSVRHIMVISDSAYSGAMTRSSLARLDPGITDKRREQWIKRMLKARSRTVLTSGGLKPVMDGGGGQHSVFANALIKTLKNNTTLLEGQSLYRKISSEVTKIAAAYGIEQVPEYAPIRHSGHEAGEFFFVPLSIKSDINVKNSK